jgi:predicted Zn-dependent protease
MGFSLSCKVNITPESISRTWTAIKNARKDLTPENEYYIGRSVGTNLLAKADYRYVDREAIRAGRLEGTTQYINKVAQVVAAAAVATTRKGDRPTPIAGWHVTIIEDETINAFAAPGGYIYITTGAVKAARSEDEIAAVIAHEIAHVVRGHAIGSIKKSRWAGVYKEALDSTVQLDAATLGKLTKTFENALDDMVNSLLVKGYSRKTEYEADRVGLQILAYSGYDPSAFVSYLRTLARQQHTGGGGFSSTHPKATDRIKKLTAQLKKMRWKRAAPFRAQRFLAATAGLRGAEMPE